MSETNSSLRCQLGCWLTAAVAGAVAAVVMIVVGDVSINGSVFLGLVLTVGLGVVLSWLLCRPLPTLAEVQARGPGSAGKSAVGHADHTTASSDDAEAPAARAGAQSGAMSASTASAASSGARSKTTADTNMDADASEAGSHVPPIGSSAATDQRAQAATDMPSEVPPIGASAATDERASGATEMPSEVPPIGSAAASGSSGGASASADQGEDYDKDGVVEGKDEGSKPPVLTAPRDGKADNLKEIKGIGPKLEKMLNGKGIYHFDQVAKWTDQELAWVDANIEGFKGRASRDEWVNQAKVLAAGGETEFSKRVDEGDVY